MSHVWWPGPPAACLSAVSYFTRGASTPGAHHPSSDAAGDTDRMRRRGNRPPIGHCCIQNQRSTLCGSKRGGWTWQTSPCACSTEPHAQRASAPRPQQRPETDARRGMPRSPLEGGGMQEWECKPRLPPSSRSAWMICGGPSRPADSMWNRHHHSIPTCTSPNTKTSTRRSPCRAAGESLPLES